MANFDHILGDSSLQYDFLRVLDALAITADHIQRADEVKQLLGRRDEPCDFHMTQFHSGR